jgi:hypothetical protein
MEWNEIAPFEDQIHQPSIRRKQLCDLIFNLDEKKINQLANIGEIVAKKDLVKQILNFCPKSMESLSTTLIYCYDLTTLNDLT